MRSPFHPEFPFRPASTPFFYGWVVVGVATLGIIMSIPGQTMGVSVFTDPLIEVTGLSRLELANAYLGGTITSALLLPFGGSLLDRWGARRLVVLASIGLALTLVVLSQIDHVIALVGGSGVAAFLVLMLGFVALRFSGQGMLTMVSRTMIGKWFDRRRGFVAGVAGLFMAFGFAAAPLGLSAAIDVGGWRGAWLGLAAVIGVGMGAIGWLLYRDNPEECGLLMDGDEAPDAGGLTEKSGTPIAADATRGEAARSISFWSVTLALAFQGLLITGITFHIVDIGALAGMERSSVVAIFLPMAVISTCTGFIAGWAADRVPIQRLILVMMVAQAVGVSSAANLEQPLFFWTTTLGLGVAGGFWGPISTVALPRFFGRLHLGAIGGLSMMCIVLGSAVGPSILALSKASTGHYSMGLYAGCALPIIGFALALLAPDPVTPPLRAR